MGDYWCHWCGVRSSMMGHRACQERAKPRLRILPSGWVRHHGGPLPNWLKLVPVDTLRRSGNAQFLNGLDAEIHTGWEHTGFSSDVLYWRPTRGNPYVRS